MPSVELESSHYMTALVDLIGRTGASNVQVRYSDDETPTVWLAVAEYPKQSAVPNIGGAGKSLRVKHLAETAAALDPVLALYRLVELIVDGGQCTHCQRMTMLWESWTNPPRDPASGEVCFHVYDPELAKFTIGCKFGAH